MALASVDQCDGDHIEKVLPRIFARPVRYHRAIMESIGIVLYKSGTNVRYRPTPTVRERRLASLNDHSHLLIYSNHGCPEVVIVQFDAARS